MSDKAIAKHCREKFGRVAARRENIVFNKYTGKNTSTRSFRAWQKHHKKSEDYESAMRERDASIERDKKSGAYERNRQKIASWNPTAPKLAYETTRREKREKSKKTK